MNAFGEQEPIKPRGYLEVQEALKNEPLPPIGEEWILPSSPLHKPIKVKVEEYAGGCGVLLTIHSGWRQKKTEHWLRKNFTYARKKDST